MKKTLITLLALCGVAAAAEQTITLSDYGYTDGFYATSVLDLDDLTSIITQKNLDTTLIGVGVYGDAGQKSDGTPVAAFGEHSAVLTVKSWTNNEFHLYYNKAAGVDASGFGNASASFSAPDGYTWPQGHAINNAFENMENAVGGALTFAFAPKDAATDVYGISVALTVAYADGSITTIVGNASKYSWSDNDYKATKIFYDDAYITAPTVTKAGNWTHADLVAANKAALGVPEPTTATLSLLTLAGLAARRRRK